MTTTTKLTTNKVLELIAGQANGRNKVDLSGADLQGLDLSQVDLSRVRLLESEHGCEKAWG